MQNSQLNLNVKYILVYIYPNYCMKLFKLKNLLIVYLQFKFHLYFYLLNLAILPGASCPGMGRCPSGAPGQDWGQVGGVVSLTCLCGLGQSPA